MLGNIIEVSASCAAVILILLVLSPVLKRCGAKWRCMVWLVLAVRLLIPIQFSFIQVPAPALHGATVQNEEVVSGIEKAADSAESYLHGETAETVPEDVTLAEETTEIRRLTAYILTFLWAGGAILLLLYHILSNAVFRLRIKRYLHGCGEYRRIRVYQCARIKSPFMMGLVRPAIVLPETEYTEQERELILKHEYTHYKRGDLWYKLLMLICNSVHWFNPCVWIMRYAAFRDLEFFCDDAVCTEMDLAGRKEYSMALLRMMRS